MVKGVETEGQADVGFGLQGAWRDPETLLRFSDTIEDLFEGVTAYTMDEQDDDWLAARNRAVQHERDNPVLPRSARKAKGRPKAAPASPPPPREVASEDDFEKVMDMFERDTHGVSAIGRVVRVGAGELSGRLVADTGSTSFVGSSEARVRAAPGQRRGGNFAGAGGGGLPALARKARQSGRATDHPSSSDSGQFKQQQVQQLRPR